MENFMYRVKLECVTTITRGTTIDKIERFVFTDSKLALNDCFCNINNSFSAIFNLDHINYAEIKGTIENEIMNYINSGRIRSYEIFKKRVNTRRGTKLYRVSIRREGC